MTTTTAAAPSKLPLWRTIGQAYALWASNFPELIRICWVWMLIMTPVLGLWLWWQEPYLADLMAAARSGTPAKDPAPVLSLLRQIIGQVIMLPALASIAVAWHRLLLKDEHPGAGAYLRLDHIVAAYAMLFFWLGLIGLAPTYVATIFEAITGTSAAGGDTAALTMQVVAGFVTIVLFFIVVRLSLALPAVALGREDVTFGVAWRASRRNSWRMIWAYFFCLLPWMTINGVMTYWIFSPEQSRLAGTLVWLVLSLMWIPVGMISVGMLSLAYRHFFERGTV